MNRTLSFPAVSPVTIHPCCSQSEFHFRNVLLLLQPYLFCPVGSFLFALASSHHHCVLLRVTSVSHRPVFLLSYIWLSSHGEVC